jgi:PHR domain
MPNHDVTDEIIDADANEPVAPSSSQQAHTVATAPSTSAGTPARQHEPVSIKTAIKKIRFLTLTPQQFAEGPARTNLLTQSEAFAILMNISTANSVYPMPEGFSQNKNHRNVGFSFADSDTPSPPIQSVPVGQVLPLADSPHHHMGAVGVNSGVHHGSYMDELRNEQKFYCVRIIRQQTECLNTSVLDCSLTFTVDRSICVTGVQVPTQVLGGIVLDPNNVVPDRYSELLYAHLMDSQGSRLTYTHCTQRVRYNSLLEISFDRPVFIQRHKMYKVCVVFNKVGWYPMCEGYPTVNCENVCFTFGVGSQSESNRDGLIRSIIFTYSREGQTGMIGLP